MRFAHALSRGFLTFLVLLLLRAQYPHIDHVLDLT